MAPFSLLRGAPRRGLFRGCRPPSPLPTSHWSGQPLSTHACPGFASLRACSVIGSRWRESGPTLSAGVATFVQGLALSFPLTSFPTAANLPICDTCGIKTHSLCPTGREPIRFPCRVASRLPLVARGNREDQESGIRWVLLQAASQYARVVCERAGP